MATVEYFLRCIIAGCVESSMESSLWDDMREIIYVHPAIDDLTDIILQRWLHGWLYTIRCDPCVSFVAHNWIALNNTGIPCEVWEKDCIWIVGVRRKKVLCFKNNTEKLSCIKITHKVTQYVLVVRFGVTWSYLISLLFFFIIAVSVITILICFIFILNLQINFI